jgi:hypothetical protein
MRFASQQCCTIIDEKTLPNFNIPLVSDQAVHREVRLQIEVELFRNLFITSLELNDFSCRVGATCITEILDPSSIHETTAQHFKRTIGAIRNPNMRPKSFKSPMETGLFANFFHMFLISWFSVIFVFSPLRKRTNILI